jgi:glycosyltransferase involved in cell wall biosynthesis
MSETPELSAILTTHNRAHLLPHVLDGLATQRLGHDRFEVVVIDDGSVDHTQAVLESFKNRLPLRVFRQQQSGLAAAKNMGIFLSRAPILLFLDDDDVADPDLLIAHLGAHICHRDPAIAVLGHTLLDPKVADLPLMRHVTGAGGQLFSQGWMRPGEMLTFREFWGGRSSCKRALLTEFGVFNPVFRFGCEDIELGWRLHQQANLRVLYEPAARTRMIRALSFDDFCRRSHRQGRSQWVFAQLHPVPTVRDYCEIEAVHALWPQLRMDFGSVIRHARALDQMLLRAGPQAPPLTEETRADLDAAYANAFRLCRLKGLADAASLPPVIVAPEVFNIAAVNLFHAPAMALAG